MLSVRLWIARRLARVLLVGRPAERGCAFCGRLPSGPPAAPAPPARPVDVGLVQRLVRDELAAAIHDADTVTASLFAEALVRGLVDLTAWPEYRALWRHDPAGAS